MLPNGFPTVDAEGFEVDAGVRYDRDAGLVGAG
jgi:hypothetical protein